MRKVPKVVSHLRTEEVKEKIRTAEGFGRQKWLIVWNAMVAPRAAEEIALHTGVALDTVYQTISRYNRFGPTALIGHGKGGRRNSYLSLEEEKEFVEKFRKKAQTGQIVTCLEIKQAYEELVGTTVAASTISRLLQRQKWRKVVPRSYHPKADPIEQESFKKTFLN